METSFFLNIVHICLIVNMDSAHFFFDAFSPDFKALEMRFASLLAKLGFEVALFSPVGDFARFRAFSSAVELFFLERWEIAILSRLP